MGVVSRNTSDKMKAILFISFVVSSSIAVEVNLTPNPKSSMSRTLCCLTANLQASGLCSGVCASRDCAELCYVRCGIFSSICSQNACSTYTTSCTTTAAPTTAAATTAAATTAAATTVAATPAATTIGCCSLPQNIGVVG